MRKIQLAFIAIVVGVCVLFYAVLFHDMLHREPEKGGYWFEPQADITPFELATILKEVCSANYASKRCGVSQDFADHDPYWEFINRHFIAKDK